MPEHETAEGLDRKEVEPFNIAGAKVVVTGANGFVGKRLVSHLLNADCKVIGLDLGTENELNEDDGYQYKSCDLTKPYPSTNSP